MKRVLIPILVGIIAFSFLPLAGFSAEKSTFLNLSLDSIETSVCPGESVQTLLTVRADPSNTENCNITLTPSDEWIILEITNFTLSPGASRQVKVTLIAGEKTPGTYQGSITMTSNCKPEHVEIPVFLHVLEPTFSVSPQTIDLELKPYDEKIVNIYIQNGKCSVNLTISSTADLIEGSLFGIIYQKSLSLSPYQRVILPVRVKTNGLMENSMIQMFFDSPYTEHSETFGTQTAKINLSIQIPITVEGEIVEINEDEGYIIIETPDGKRYKIILREEDKGKYKEGEYIEVEGIKIGENEIIPEKITYIKKECNYRILGPGEVIFCPWCPDKEKVTKAWVENTGEVNIGVSISWDEFDDPFTITFSPQSFSLAPGEGKEIEVKVKFKNPEELTNTYFEQDKYPVFVNFSVTCFTDPPTTSTQKETMFVEICDRRRNISGKVTFRTPGGKECPIKGAKVFLLIKDKVEGLESFCPGFLLKEEEEIHSLNVDDSFYDGIPRDPVYYTKTYTEDDGTFKFEEFLDPKCKHNYAIIVVFQSSDYFGPNLTYCNCEKTFFVRKDINKTTFPCSPTHSEVNIYIGKKGDKKYDSSLKMPKDFSCIKGNYYNMKSPPTGVDMAQIWCHIMESYKLFKDLHCDSEGALKPMKLKICAFSKEFDNSEDEGEGAFYYNGEIHIGPLDSHQGDNDEPMNREWHEFGHYLHDCLYGIPERSEGDVNHANFKNSNTTDSFLEGFAEFISMLTLKLLKDRGTCCYDLSTIDNGNYNGWGDLENNENQPLGGLFIEYKGKKVAVKHDVNGIPYIRVNGRTIRPVFFSQNADGSFNIRFVDGGPQSIPLQMENSYEEFAAASVLLDLVDKGSWYKGGNDDDGLSIDWKELLCFIKKEKIKDMRDLYEKLRERYDHEKIDDIFERNGFFQDKNLNRIRDEGEEIGYTYRPKIKIDGTTVDEIKRRRDFPFPENAYVIVNLMDEEGREIDEADIRIEFKTFEGTVSVVERSIKNGERVPILIPPDSNCFVVISMKDSKGKPIIITEDEFWDALLNDKSYIKEGTLIKTDKEASPEILLDTQELYLEGLLEGEKETFYLYFVNSGGGILNVSFSTSKSWIKVEPQEFEGNAGFIKVTVDTKGLSGGMNRGKVIVSGNGGEREVNVSVSVVPKVKKTVIELFIGSVTAYINGEVYTLDAAPYVKPPDKPFVSTVTFMKPALPSNS